MSLDPVTLKVVRAGDALAAALREVTGIGVSRKLGAEWKDTVLRLRAEWYEATRGMKP